MRFALILYCVDSHNWLRQWTMVEASLSTCTRKWNREWKQTPKRALSRCTAAQNVNLSYSVLTVYNKTALVPSCWIRYTPNCDFFPTTKQFSKPNKWESKVQVQAEYTIWRIKTRWILWHSYNIWYEPVEKCQKTWRESARIWTRYKK